VLASGHTTVASGPFHLHFHLAQTPIAVILNLFSDASQIQTNNFVREQH